MFEIFFGMLWRYIKGRDWKYPNWNAYLVGFLLSYCWFNWGFEGVGVALLVTVNLLSGYESFTLPWIPHKLKCMWLNARLILLKGSGEYCRLIGTEKDLKRRLNREKETFERHNGWESWHTVYRFTIPALLCYLHVPQVEVLLYASLCTFAGFMFPFTTWAWKKGYIKRYPHEVNELILGACAVGGLAILKGFAYA